MQGKPDAVRHMLMFALLQGVCAENMSVTPSSGTAHHFAWGGHAVVAPVVAWCHSVNRVTSILRDVETGIARSKSHHMLQSCMVCLMMIMMSG